LASLLLCFTIIASTVNSSDLVKQTIGDSSSVSRTSGYFMWVGAHYRLSIVSTFAHQQSRAFNT
jgi:hypothetical protein